MAFTIIQTVGLIKMLHHVSTTNYQTVSLSTKLSNYKQRSERYRPLTLILVTHGGTREILRLYSKLGYSTFISLSTIMGGIFLQNTLHKHLFQQIPQDKI
jgi:hypothetical protein